jgi:TPR repeat protein/serine/threonine protein kinase
MLTQADSGFTYTANNGGIVIQEYFPLQFALRDQDGVSLLLCDADFNPDFEQGLSEFLLLARVLSQIDHPGRISRYEEKDGTAWYAVDLRIRASLADLLDTGERLPEETLKTVLYSAVTYLDAAHDAGALHLELSPQRILLADEDKLLICGFNTDKLHYPTEDKSTGHDYRAPELASFRGQLGRWTDYYALGAILYQGACLAGPTDALTRLSVTDRGQDDPLVPAIEAGKDYFSRSILTLIDQLLALEPTARPQDAEAIVSALDPTASIQAAVDSESEPIRNSATNDSRPSVEPIDPPQAGFNSHSPTLPQAGSKPLRGATAIALSALDKALKDQNPEKNEARSRSNAMPRVNTTIHVPTEAKPASPTRTAQGKGSARQEPVFSASREAFEDTLKALEVTRSSSPPLEIANDLESAGKVLTGKPYNDFTLRPTNSGKHRTTPHQPPRSTGSFLGTVGRALGSSLQGLYRHLTMRLALGALIALSALLVIYLLATPRPAPSETTTRTTIEIIGATTHEPPPEPSRGSPNIQQVVNTSLPAAAQDFLKQDDLDRVNAYRDAEQLKLLSEPHFARAQGYLAQGRLIDPPNANAYSEFTAILRMDPQSRTATRGVEEIIGRILTRIDNLVDAEEFTIAREQLSLATSVIAGHKHFIQTAAQIDRAQTHWQEELAREKALAQAQMEQQRLEREQRQQIEALLARARTAFDTDRLIDPPGENALTLYRAALDLDPANQRARNGIGNITAIYLRQARDALSQNELSNAAQSLQIAKAIDPTHAGVDTLIEHLQRREYLATERQRLQAEADARISEAREIAKEQDQLNLAGGIKSYYAGNYREAYQFLQPLAERNYPRAQVRVARMLLEARGTDRDKPRAIGMFSAALAPVQLAASQGKAWAQSDLADFYFDGLVIDTDYRTAAFWYQKSAEQGYAPAQTNLGVLYMTGYEGVPPNRAVAVHWFNVAALQGNRAAADNLRVLGEAEPSNAGG